MPTPMPAVCGLTFLNSISAGLVTSGIYFLTKGAYAFSNSENTLLGVVVGVTYILGAFYAGRVCRWTCSVLRLSQRGMLALLIALCALLCLVPLLTARAGVRTAWPVWLTVTLYTPLTGMLWPVVESFLSGGRSHSRLLRTVMIWSVVWSGALVVAFVGISPYIKEHARSALLVLGCVHALSLLLLPAFPREPAAHDAHAAAAVPEVYSRLLATFRVLLPTSYLICSALQSYLPGMMERLAVPEDQRTLWMAAWLATRCLTFFLLMLWGGWHGRWFPAVVGVVTLIVGFAGCVLSRVVGGEQLGMAQGLLLGGLAVFGVGMGIVYSGAIYYAMEVGSAQVEAGGTHEALIGVGYTLGPALALVAALGVERGMLSDIQGDGAVMALVGAATLLIAVYVVRRVRTMTAKTP
jgi:hypothetical protein